MKILSTLLLTFLSHPQYLPQHHKYHSPKAHCNSLHPPVNLSISLPNISPSTTNLIPLMPIAILSNLLLTSPSHPPYLPQHHKSHSPKAHQNSLHPPVNVSISPPNISLNTTNLIPLKLITILSILLLTSPSHPPISTSAPQISFP